MSAKKEAIYASKANVPRRVEQTQLLADESLGERRLMRMCAPHNKPAVK